MEKIPKTPTSNIGKIGITERSNVKSLKIFSSWGSMNILTLICL